MASSETYSGSFYLLDHPLLPISTCSWVTMSTGANRVPSAYVYYSLIKSSTPIISTSSEAIMSAHHSIGHTASTTNVLPLLSLGSRRYSIKLWKSFVQCFNCMPAAALVSNTILCMHGGLSPNMFQVQEISDKIKRPCDIGTQGLLCDLLWADPLNSDCLFGQSDRGAGYTFGK